MRSWFTFHDDVFWFLEAQCEAGPNAGNDVDENDSDGVKWVREAEEDVEEVGEHLGQSSAEAVGDALLQVVEDEAPLPDRPCVAGQGVVQQHHPGRVLGDV